ncbi:hypothetical protein ACWE42_16820 [Sutcliffiella cohnii]
MDIMKVKGLVDNFKKQLREEISKEITDFGEKEYYTIGSQIYSLENSEVISKGEIDFELSVLVNAYNSLNCKENYVDAKLDVEGKPVEKLFDVREYLFQNRVR